METLASLLELAADDRWPGWVELSQDVVFRHLTPEQRRQYVTEALKAGRDAAVRYASGPRAGAMAGNGTDDDALAMTQSLATTLGARVQVANTAPQAAGITIRADYDPSRRTITLYRPAIAQAAQHLDRLLPGQWTEAKLMAVHLAHELFHHLEAVHEGPVSHRLPPVVTFRLGRLFTVRSRARRCREIGAHGFARQLLDLPLFPNVLDWLVLAAEGRCSVRDVERLLLQARAAWEGGPDSA
ncbi:MAG: hypothetical protein DIU70_008680 [Bacillota bacterium]